MARHHVVHSLGAHMSQETPFTMNCTITFQRLRRSSMQVHFRQHEGWSVAQPAHYHLTLLAPRNSERAPSPRHRIYHPCLFLLQAAESTATRPSYPIADSLVWHPCSHGKTSVRNPCLELGTLTSDTGSDEESALHANTQTIPPHRLFALS